MSSLNGVGMEQLMLFCDPDDQILKREIGYLREQCEKIRKGQYAKIAVLSKQVRDLQEELDNMKRAVCQGQFDRSSQLDLFVPLKMVSSLA